MIEMEFTAISDCNTLPFLKRFKKHHIRYVKEQTERREVIDGNVLANHLHIHFGDTDVGHSVIENGKTLITVSNPSYLAFMITPLAAL